MITVEVTLLPNDNERHYVKDLSYAVNGDDSIIYAIKYEYKPRNVKDIYKSVQSIMKMEDITTQIMDSIKMNLLPTDLYMYFIEVPDKGKVSYDTLGQFKYTALMAERDDFSVTNERLGSKSLVRLLQMKLSDEDKLKVEREYTEFFDTLKSLSGMDTILNWQDNTALGNAKEFFKRIRILPNMPAMNSIFSSVRLGYSDENLSYQGLGHRNLILLLVHINSLLRNDEGIALNVLTVEEPEAHLCINNIRLLVSFIKTVKEQHHRVQIFYSTHNAEFINKLNLGDVVIVSDGNAYALATELNDEGRDYLSKNPNLDLYKLFFSKRCILVEGLTDELLIRAYLDSKRELNNVEVIAFHKGFNSIIDIWLRVNQKTSNRLGIVRDFDNQIKAQAEHEKYNIPGKVIVRTTTQYTLEPEILETGNNYEILQQKYKDAFNWGSLSKEDLKTEWSNAKSAVMLQVCRDIVTGELEGFKMPHHIQEIIDFLCCKE